MVFLLFRLRILSHSGSVMGVSISKKYRCNTIGFASNKENKPETVSIPLDRVAIHYEELNIVVLKPVIDTLVFGFSPTQEFLSKYDQHIDSKEYEKEIRVSIVQDAYHTASTGVSYVTGVPLMKAPYKNYNINLRYKPPSSTETIFIQVDPKNTAKTTAFIRFQMNPSRFSKKALEEIRAFITDTLLPAVPVIPFDDIMEQCKVYRADIAVDLLGVRPAELEVVSKKGGQPVPSKSNTYKSRTGRTESIYTKLKKDKSNNEYIYDKRQQLLDKGMPLSYGDCLHSRFECRIEKTTFYKLNNLKNRFNRLSIRAVDYRALHKMHYTHQLFLRLALSRTLEKALEVIPPKNQPKFMKKYQSSLHNIWDAKQLWAHWKEAAKLAAIFLPK